MNEERLRRAILAVEGLAMGDAYGNHHGKNSEKHQAPLWQFTDDTLMALSITENLRLYNEINQDVLAQSFANRRDGDRGYGSGVTRLLKRIQHGIDWREASRTMFAREGSYGNGAAMRVAPIGAYFADDLKKVSEQAQLSATVTHMHPEGVAGAIGVAIATAIAFRYKDVDPPDWSTWLAEVMSHIPESEIRDKVKMSLDLDVSTDEAGKILGIGRPSIAQMTVPFALWCASRFLNDYEKAIRQTASVQGDVDTNCAIVGGIVIMSVGLNKIPERWLVRREKLPLWAFEN